MAEVQKDTLGSTEDTLRFLDLIGMFGSQAMMALGKVMNPVTHKAAKNLDAARLFIDALEMIERKTKGNLTADESKVLRATLTDLHLMFVEESKSPAAPATSTREGEAPAEPPPSAAATEPAKPGEDKPKFHKSYE